MNIKGVYMSTYRSLWIKTYGSIPDGYEIHHIDGDRTNNDIENLMCVSLEEHYNIHYRQGDYLACSIMSKRMRLTQEERKEIHKRAMATRDQSGEKNPMYGRSAIVERNMKWYNDGTHETMFTEGKEPSGYIRGRLYYPVYDKSGSNNPMHGRSAIVEQQLKWYNDGTHETMFTEGKEPSGYIRGRLFKRNAKKVIVNDVTYDSLKDACGDYPNVSYSTMRRIAIAKNNKVNKHGLEITYAES